MNENRKELIGSSLHLANLFKRLLKCRG